MDKAKVVEIFSSIQGEGPYAGVWQTFVRFFGCHMHCTWCDTPESIGDTVQQFDTYDVEALVETVLHESGARHSVSITGGEPLMQKAFLKTFLPQLRGAEQSIYLETSGVLYRALSEIINFIDVVAMDIKLPSSTGCRSYWQEHQKFLAIAQQKEVFVKVVISRDTLQKDLEACCELMAAVDPAVLLILQPNTAELFAPVPGQNLEQVNKDLIDKCVAWQQICAQRLNQVRVSPQIHPLLKLR